MLFLCIILVKDIYNTFLLLILLNCKRVRCTPSMITLGFSGTTQANLTAQYYSAATWNNM